MPQSFDRETWKARIAAWWQAAVRDLPQVRACLGVDTAYGLLTASAFIPLLDVYGQNAGSAIRTLVEVVGGVGGDLVANLVQGAYDRDAAPPQVEQEIAENPDLRAGYEALLSKLDVLSVAQESLGEQWADFRTELAVELETMGGGLHLETGGGAVIFGSVKVERGDFVGRDKHEHYHDHYHYAPSPSPDFTPQRKAYLRHVIARTSRLPLRGVDVGAGDPARATRPRLAQVYVDLDTKIYIAPEVLGRIQAGGSVDLVGEEIGRPQTTIIDEVVTARQDRPLSALLATRIIQRCVILGGPGSGKSTFVNHLAFCLAQHALKPEEGWLTHLSGWSEDGADLIPVVVTLRDFASWATSRGEAELATIGAFLAHRLAEWELPDFVKPLQGALRNGQVMVFFDGLDEILTGAQREGVRDAVAAFAKTYEKARIVVTCRTLSYQEPAWQLPRETFPRFELAPFTEDKIASFIKAWYAELTDLGAVRMEDTGALIAQLQAAVQRRDIVPLAFNPLLLTVMALVHTHRGRLPEARALLYEECTDLLLWRWEERKGEMLGLRALLAEARLQEVDLKRGLRELAFAAHRGNGDEVGVTADIAEVALWKALRDLHPERSLDWAERMVAQIKERAGLLVEREPGVYAFPHRTFQEYLAGSHLSVQADFPQRAVELATEAAFWREVILLAVGRQVHVMETLAQPLALVAELCPAACVEQDEGWRRAWLAGEVLRETGVNRVRQSQQGRDLLSRLQERLCDLVEGGHLTARERAEVGDVLGQLGDPRFDPDVHYLPTRYLSELEPMLGFVKVPAGPFVMGEAEKAHRVEIPYDYWIARYPVTVAQYGCFVTGDGYAEPAYWTDIGWTWRQGEWDSEVEEKWLRDHLECRPSDIRNHPMGWRNQQRYPTRPVVGVSWFEAIAYGHWLAEQLRREDTTGWVAANFGYEAFVVRLPSEAEWEKAARASDDRCYPWGDVDWDEERGNVDRSQIGHTSPVGLYPRGVNPWGLHEMMGNVWEWTMTRYATYPYAPDDNREALDGEDPRVLRGGSWYTYPRNARCAVRLWNIPDLFNTSDGFRVVISRDAFDS